MTEVYEPDTHPKDLNPVPRSFDAGLLNKGQPLPYNDVAPGIGFSRVYWIYGPEPKHSRFRSEVSDPPCAGWSSCFVLHETDKHVRLFCPYTMRSWKVSRMSYEFQSLAGHFPPIPAENHKLRFELKWKEYKRRGEAVDFFVAEEIMDALGVDIPTDQECDAFSIPARKHSIAIKQTVKEAKKADKLIRPVKREGRRGEVLAHFLEFDGNMGSILDATTKFEITRSNLLSQFSLMRKNHGIEYVVSGDTATLQLPEGCDDPFE